MNVQSAGDETVKVVEALADKLGIAVESAVEILAPLASTMVQETVAWGASQIWIGIAISTAIFLVGVIVHGMLRHLAENELDERSMTVAVFLICTILILMVGGSMVAEGLHKMTRPVYATINNLTR